MRVKLVIAFCVAAGSEAHLEQHMEVWIHDFAAALLAGVADDFIHDAVREHVAAVTAALPATSRDR